MSETHTHTHTHTQQQTFASGFVDFRRLWQLAVRLERSRFVGVVFQNYVTLVVLKVSQTDQDDISLREITRVEHRTGAIHKNRQQQKNTSRGRERRLTWLTQTFFRILPRM
jgi:hypothetical protein